MFDKLLRELKALESTKVSIPLETDADGYFDKECPAENCLFGFKVHGEDWKAIIRDEEMFCPSCRHAAPAKSWFTTEQVERAKEQAVAHMQGRINSAMREDAQAWNRRQPRNSFLKITMNVSGGGGPPLLLPIAAAEPMRLRTQCDACGCRYSYIGAAFFCPACGENSAKHTFTQTLSTIRTSVRSGPQIRQAFEKDEAENLMRMLLEKGFQDAVMCFQRLNEQQVELLSEPPAVRRNLFQNLEDGSRFWEAAIGKGYEAMLDAPSLARLQRYFQQRHLLAHRQGIVDDDYIQRSADTGYVAGQRLVLKERDALDMVDLVEALGTAVIAAVQDRR